MCFVLRRMHQNLYVSQTVLLSNSYGNMWENIKLHHNPFSQCRSAPHKGGFSTAVSLPNNLPCSRRTVVSAGDQGSCWSPLDPTSPASHSKGQRMVPAKQLRYCRENKASIRGDARKPDLPLSSHHCIGSPATIQLFLHCCLFLVLEQQGAHHSNWFHGRKSGRSLHSSWEEDCEEFLQVRRVSFNQALKD